MRDYINIGSTPPEEDCAQVGSEDYGNKSRLECCLYKLALRRFLGVEPEGALLQIKQFPHDFGYYKEVVCYYDDQLPASVDYAFSCESDGPLRWVDALMGCQTCTQYIPGKPCVNNTKHPCKQQPSDFCLYYDAISWLDERSY
ncbi:MAG: hypothetical protein WC449_05295 [Candidatus Paceibacterota bacterium]